MPPKKAKRGSKTLASQSFEPKKTRNNSIFNWSKGLFHIFGGVAFAEDMLSWPEILANEARKGSEHAQEASFLAARLGF